MINKAGLLFLIVSSALLSSCMLGPNFHSPSPPNTNRYTRNPLPGKTVNTAEDSNAGKSQLFVYKRDIPYEWWQLYHSKPLNEILNQGIVNSPNLASAVAALKQAREILNVQIGNLLLPALNANLNATRNRVSGLSFDSSSPSSVFNIYNAGAAVSYTLDVFGANRRQVEASAAQMDYAQYQLDAAYLTLTTNIVTTSVTASSLQAQVNATRELINEETKTLAIVKKQYRLGGSSLQNVLSQETQLEQTRALLPPLEKNLASSQHALAVLVGELPSESKLPMIPLGSLTLPKELPISVPSELVKRRPDVKAAEAQLHAATAQVGVATANLFPSITLTGSYGWTANTPASLFNTNAEVWSMAAGLTQPIFHGGALIAARRAAIAAYEQAEAQYHQTVLRAFQNVADALRAVEIDAREYKAQRRAELAARATYVMTKKQYRLGGASYLQLLSAEQQYQTTKVARIQAQAARYTDTAALFAALGGGWWHVDVECLAIQKARARA